MGNFSSECLMARGVSQPTERELFRKWVHAWGIPASFRLFEPGCCHFMVPEIEGVIAYQRESSVAVVFGDPICSLPNRARLALAFQKYCDSQHLAIVYVTVSQTFAQWAMENGCKAWLQATEELSLNPSTLADPSAGAGGRMLRKKMNHARREGTLVLEYTGRDPSLEHAMEEVKKAWLQGRSGLQIFLTESELFDEREDRRWFYAVQGERLVGMALLHYLAARQGWLLSMLCAIPNAPAGTTELLLMTVLEVFKKENCGYLTFGTTPKREFGELRGFSSLSEWITCKSYKLARHFFPLDGRRDYWMKFHPQSEQSYFLFTKRSPKIKEIRAILRAYHVPI